MDKSKCIIIFLSREAFKKVKLYNFKLCKKDNSPYGFFLDCPVISEKKTMFLVYQNYHCVFLHSGFAIRMDLISQQKRD